MRDLRIIEFLASVPWAIRPEKLDVLASVALAHIEGRIRLTSVDASAERTERAEARRLAFDDETGSPTCARVRTGDDGAEGVGVIGVIPIHGTIFPRGGGLLDSSGVTTTESIRNRLASLVNDDGVDGILFDIDSPGGAVAGIPETADAIFNARGKKPIKAQVWDQCCSAAYWLASQTDEIVTTPSGSVGSIGVLAMHTDFSEALAKAGRKVTILKSSDAPHKAEFNPYEPLSKEAREHEQGVLNELHGEFANAIARGRGITTDAVKENFGGGRVFRAVNAVKRGMADSVGTFDETVTRMVTSFQTGRAMLAADCTRRSRRRRLI